MPSARPGHDKNGAPLAVDPIVELAARIDAEAGTKWAPMGTDALRALVESGAAAADIVLVVRFAKHTSLDSDWARKRPEAMQYFQPRFVYDPARFADRLQKARRWVGINDRPTHSIPPSDTRRLIAAGAVLGPEKPAGDWGRVCDALETELGAAVVKAWLWPLALGGDGSLTAPSRHHARWVENSYMAEIGAVASAAGVRINTESCLTR